MSTIQEFENAPIGATATAPNGDIALNTGRFAFDWAVYDPRGGFCGLRRSADMGGFTLNPAAPTTACEALDLAWELAYPVKEGQVIPAGTRYLEIHNTELRETSLPRDIRVSHGLVPKVRTIDPLPDPKPGWVDAPAVVAFVKGRVGDPQVFSRGNETGTQWVRDSKVYHWYELIGVVPLYPKEDKGGMEITGSGEIQFKDRNGRIVWEV